jgi:formate hydrogenlyase subunit 3/multisubunit Na+/H+ antiporter MnhD subunit
MEVKKKGKKYAVFSGFFFEFFLLSSVFEAKEEKKVHYLLLSSTLTASLSLSLSHARALTLTHTLSDLQTRNYYTEEARIAEFRTKRVTLHSKP